jgi:hypothetical protein
MNHDTMNTKAEMKDLQKHKIMSLFSLNLFLKPIVVFQKTTLFMCACSDFFHELIKFSQFQTKKY